MPIENLYIARVTDGLILVRQHKLFWINGCKSSAAFNSINPCRQLGRVNGAWQLSESGWRQNGTFQKPG